jgi:hypothetical protein
MQDILFPFARSLCGRFPIPTLREDFDFGLDCSRFGRLAAFRSNIQGQVRLLLILISSFRRRIWLAEV